MAPHTPSARPSSAQGLTTRAAVLALVLCTLVVSAAVPLRTYLTQHSQIASQVAAQRAQEERVAELQQQVAQYRDPAFVKAQVEARLHYVLPGETPYVLLAPTAAPAPATAGATAQAGPTGPWWSQVWGTVQSADK